jgi:hypothetical protein
VATITLLTPTRAQLGAIVLDASISEQHSAEVEVTEHPVEKGANIADHLRPKPEVLTIEGLVTNTPLDPSAALVRRTQGSTQFDSRAELQPERAGQAYADLRALKDSGELVTVVTSLRTYENMALRSLSVPRDARSGQALRFTATLVQVRTVTSATVSVPRAQKKTSLGKKATTATPAEQVNKSTLKQLADTPTGDRLFKALGIR